GLVGDEVLEFEKFIFIPDEYGANESVLVNDAFFIVAFGLVDKYNFFIFRVRTVYHTDATEIKPLYLDDVHKDGTGIVTADVAVMVAGDDGALLFGRCRNTVKHAFVLGDFTNGIDGRVAGLYAGIDNHAPLALQAGCFGQLDVGRRANGYNDGVAFYLPAALEFDFIDFVPAVIELYLVVIVDVAALIDHLFVEELAT